MKRRITVAIETLHFQTDTRTRVTGLSGVYETVEDALVFLQTVKDNPIGLSALPGVTISETVVEVKRPKPAAISQVGNLVMAAARFDGAHGSAARPPQLSSQSDISGKCS